MVSQGRGSVHAQGQQAAGARGEAAGDVSVLAAGAPGAHAERLAAEGAGGQLGVPLHEACREDGLAGAGHSQHLGLRAQLDCLQVVSAAVEGRVHHAVNHRRREQQPVEECVAHGRHAPYLPPGVWLWPGVHRVACVEAVLQHSK